MRRVRTWWLGAVVVGGALVVGCAPKDVGEAEAKKDVGWLATTATSDAVAALGRLADADPKALAALEGRAATDVNVYIAAWQAVVRGQPWGEKIMRQGLADPLRADLAASAMPRKEARVAPFVNDLEGAVVRLAAGKRGSVIAGVLASIGAPAHAAVERRLVDPKTRSAMCDGIGLPEASADARGLVLKVGPEARDQASCVGVVLGLATREDPVLDWLSKSAEPGLFAAAARSEMPCPRLTAAWKKALVERPANEQAALIVPLKLSLGRCATALDPVLAETMGTVPGARGTIVQALDPFSAELSDLKATCATLKQRWMSAESPRVRERADDALANGCRRAR